MIIPPVTQEYDAAVQAVFNEVVEKSDQQNLKLDQDNFLTTGSICLQDGDGDWFKLGVSTISQTALTGSGDGGGYLVLEKGGHGLHSGERIRFTTTGTLPTGLAIETDYYVNTPAVMDFFISASKGGSRIAWTNGGTGTHSYYNPPSLSLIKLTGTQLDADGRPAIASTNPYS